MIKTLRSEISYILAGYIQMFYSIYKLCNISMVSFVLDFVASYDMLVYDNDVFY